jgi:hypothetical protein
MRRGEAVMVNLSDHGNGARYRSRIDDALGVPSSGSAWNRKVRCCRGWMNSAVRAIVRNERYTGLIRWNTSEWVKDPDTGKRLRRERPRSEWLEYRDEDMRIVSDELFAKAANRTKDTSNPRAHQVGRQAPLSALRPAQVRNALVGRTS